MHTWCMFAWVELLLMRSARSMGGGRQYWGWRVL